MLFILKMKVVVIAIIFWVRGLRNLVSCYNAGRNSSLCTSATCQLPIVCTTVINSPQRCVPAECQIYLLQPLTRSWNASTLYLREMEKAISYQYIMSVYNLTGDSTIRQNLESNLTTEIVNTTRLPQNIYTTLVMLDDHGFKERIDVCHALSRTSTRCLSSEDCEILRAANIKCPATFPPATNPASIPVLTGGVIALIVAVCVIILLLLGGWITMKICRHKHKGEHRGGSSDRDNYYNSSTDYYRGTARTERTDAPIPSLSTMFQPTNDMSMYKHQFDMEMSVFEDGEMPDFEDRSVSHTLSGGVAAVAAIEIQRTWRGYRTRKLVYAVLSPSPPALKYLAFNSASPTYQGIRGALNLYPLQSHAHRLVHESLGELSPGELTDNNVQEKQLISFRGFSPSSIECWWRSVLEYVDWFRQLEWGDPGDGQLSEFDASLIIQKAWSGHIDESRAVQTTQSGEDVEFVE